MQLVRTRPRLKTFKEWQYCSFASSSVADTNELLIEDWQSDSSATSSIVCMIEVKFEVFQGLAVLLIHKAFAMANERGS
ncbi:hypothetical protein SLA2020_438550 [Shorea laevis]